MGACCSTDNQPRPSQKNMQQRPQGGMATGQGYQNQPAGQVDARPGPMMQHPGTQQGGPGGQGQGPVDGRRTKASYQSAEQAQAAHNNFNGNGYATDAPGLAGTTQYGDLNGDGYQDRIEYGGPVMQQPPVLDSQIPIQSGMPGTTEFADFNGDGIMDRIDYGAPVVEEPLVVNSCGPCGDMANYGTTVYDGGVTTMDLPIVGGGVPGTTEFSDFNGDGIMDRIDYGGTNPGLGAAPLGPYILNGDGLAGTTQYGDFNGDGVIDRIEYGGVNPGLGNIAPNFGGVPGTTEYRDVNGDGIMDQITYGGQPFYNTIEEARAAQGGNGRRADDNANQSRGGKRSSRGDGGRKTKGSSRGGSRGGKPKSRTNKKKKVKKGKGRRSRK